MLRIITWLQLYSRTGCNQISSHETHSQSTGPRQQPWSRSANECQVRRHRLIRLLLPSPPPPPPPPRVVHVSTTTTLAVEQKKLKSREVHSTKGDFELGGRSLEKIDEIQMAWLGQLLMGAADLAHAAVDDRWPRDHYTYEWGVRAGPGRRAGLRPLHHHRRQKKEVAAPTAPLVER